MGLFRQVETQLGLRAPGGQGQALLNSGHIDLGTYEYRLLRPHVLQTAIAILGEVHEGRCLCIKIILINTSGKNG